MIKLRKIFTVFMLMLFFVLGTTVFAEPLILKYDGEEHEYTGNLYTLMINEEYIQTTVQPLIFNDYTLVPIRDVFEAIGATVKPLVAQSAIIEQIIGNHTHIAK